MTPEQNSANQLELPLTPKGLGYINCVWWSTECASPPARAAQTDGTLIRLHGKDADQAADRRQPGNAAAIRDGSSAAAVSIESNDSSSFLGFVNCTAEFTQQPAVLNGCSELLIELFGRKPASPAQLWEQRIAHGNHG
jgi:hypothetical protein